MSEGTFTERRGLRILAYGGTRWPRVFLRPEQGLAALAEVRKTTPGAWLLGVEEGGPYYIVLPEPEGKPWPSGSPF